MTARTMKNKIWRINNFIKVSGVKNLEDITNQEIDQWVDYMIAKHNSGRTVNGCLCQIRVMLRWEKDDGINMPNLKISRITMQKEQPPRKVYYTRAQIDKVLKEANDQEWLLIRLSFDCGLRINELRNLRLSDISDRSIRIIGKGQKLRYAKMSKETRKRLDVWIKQEKVTDYLWVSKQNRNRPMCDMCTRRTMTRPFEAAGIYDFYPHSLRHSYATELKQMGVPTRKIQAVMGHSSESITERYLGDLDGFDIDEVYDIKYHEKKRSPLNAIKKIMESHRHNYTRKQAPRW